MRIKIEFEVDNDAFATDFRGEVRRVLSQAWKKLMAGRAHNPTRAYRCLIRDANGNTIGSAELEL